MAYKDYLTEQAKLKKDGFNVPEAPSTEGVKLGTGVGAQKDISAPTTPTAPEYTFEQYLTDERARYDQLYKDTLAQIAASREKTIVDAGAARAKQVGTYGANAERLASMGLTGSGYSDYLTAQAHSAYRGDVQAANALAAQQELTAKQGYEETMAGLRKMEYEQYATQKSKVDTIKTNIDNGAYKNLSRLQEAAEAAGLSEDKVQEVLSYYNDVNKNAINTTYAESVYNEDGTTTDTLKAMTDEDIDALVSSGKITAPAAAELKKQRNEDILKFIRDETMKSKDVNNFQKYIMKYWDALGDDVSRELNYEYNAKIALDNLTSATLSGEIKGVFDEAAKGYLNEQDAVSLGAYKISAVSNVYVPEEGTKSVIKHNSKTVDENLQRALSEYAGDKVGTLVLTKDPRLMYNGMTYDTIYEGSYLLTEDGWKEVRPNGVSEDIRNKMTPKSYDLPKKDNGYSEYLTTK